MSDLVISSVFTGAFPRVAQRDWDEAERGATFKRTRASSPLRSALLNALTELEADHQIIDLRYLNI